MALTISEADAVNVVLRHVLGERSNDSLMPDEHFDRLQQACEVLADKAHKSLHAGLSAADVRARWGGA